MADQTNAWHGAVNTSWTEGGNWTLGTAPQTDASNDTLIFLANARNVPRANLDRSGDNGATGLQPQLISIQSGVRYDIGQPGAELIMRAKKVLHRGRGTLFYKSGGSSGNDTLDVTINSPNRSKAAVLTTNGLSDFVRIGVADGKVFIALDATTLFQLHVTGQNADVVLEHGTGDVTRLSQNGGIVESNLAIDLAIIHRGLLHLRGPAYGMLLQIDGGRVVYNVLGGQIIELYATGGITDLVPPGGREVLVNNLVHFPSGTVIRDEAGDIVTVTNNRTFGLDKE